MISGPPERPVSAADRAREQLLVRAMIAVWRSRIAWVSAAVLLAVAIGGALYVNSLWARTLSDSCETWPPADMSMDEMIAVKERKSEYVAAWSNDPEATLSLSPREVDTLLRGETPFTFDVIADGDVVTGRAAVPVKNGCYNLHFIGHAEVRDGAVYLSKVQQFRVGDADLTRFVTLIGTVRLSAKFIDGYVDPRVTHALANTEKLMVQDGSFHLRLHDNDGLW
jgi:hypothetical protein